MKILIKSTLLLLMVLYFPIVAYSQCNLKYNTERTIEKSQIVKLGNFLKCPNCQEFTMEIRVNKAIADRNDNLLIIFASFPEPGMVYGYINLVQGHGAVFKMLLWGGAVELCKTELFSNEGKTEISYEGMFRYSRTTDELKILSKFDVIGIEINDTYFTVNNWKGFWDAYQCLLQ